MAFVYQALAPEEAQFMSFGFPQFVRNVGTNFPVVGLAYDAASQESGFWRFEAFNYSGGGQLLVNINWYADTASTANVVWSTAIGAISPNSDTQDVETKTWAVPSSGIFSHLGTVGQRLHQASLYISSLDSLVSNDEVYLYVTRDGKSPSDTMAGDAILTQVTIAYTGAI